MKILAPLIIICLILLGIFTLANWDVLAASTQLSFILFDLTAPAGLMLLGTTLLLVALFTAYALALRTAMLMEAHRHAKEIKSLRALAEEAETSRLNELRGQIEREFLQLNEATRETRTALDARMLESEQRLRGLIEDSGGTLSAHLGEIEDKLDRKLDKSP